MAISTSFWYCCETDRVSFVSIDRRITAVRQIIRDLILDDILQINMPVLERLARKAKKGPIGDTLTLAELMQFARTRPISSYEYADWLSARDQALLAVCADALDISVSAVLAAARDGLDLAHCTLRTPKGLIHLSDLAHARVKAYLEARNCDTASLFATHEDGPVSLHDFRQMLEKHAAHLGLSIPRNVACLGDISQPARRQCVETPSTRVADQPHIQRRTIADIIRRHTRACGIELLVTPQMLRRSVATLYEESGAPIELIGALLRHADINGYYRTAIGRYVKITVDQIRVIFDRHPLRQMPLAQTAGSSQGEAARSMALPDR